MQIDSNEEGQEDTKSKSKVLETQKKYKNSFFPPKLELFQS